MPPAASMRAFGDGARRRARATVSGSSALEPIGADRNRGPTTSSARCRRSTAPPACAHDPARDAAAAHARRGPRRRRVRRPRGRRRRHERACEILLRGVARRCAARTHSATPLAGCSPRCASCSSCGGLRRAAIAELDNALRHAIHNDVAELLIAHGADLEARERDGLTPYSRRGPARRPVADGAARGPRRANGRRRRSPSGSAASLRGTIAAAAAAGGHAAALRASDLRAAADRRPAPARTSSSRACSTHGLPLDARGVDDGRRAALRGDVGPAQHGRAAAGPTARTSRSSAAPQHAPSTALGWAAWALARAAGRRRARRRLPRGRAAARRRRRARSRAGCAQSRPTTSPSCSIARASRTERRDGRDADARGAQPSRSAGQRRGARRCSAARSRASARRPKRAITASRKRSCCVGLQTLEVRAEADGLAGTPAARRARPGQGCSQQSISLEAGGAQACLGLLGAGEVPRPRPALEVLGEAGVGGRLQRRLVDRARRCPLRRTARSAGRRAAAPRRAARTARRGRAPSGTSRWRRRRRPARRARARARRDRACARRRASPASSIARAGDHVGDGVDGDHAPARQALEQQPRHAARAAAGVEHRLVAAQLEAVEDGLRHLDLRGRRRGGRSRRSSRAARRAHSAVVTGPPRSRSAS